MNRIFLLNCMFEYTLRSKDLIDLICCKYLPFRNRSLLVQTRDKFLSAAMQNTLDFKSLAKNILEIENAIQELRVTDLSADPVHEEQLFALSQTPYYRICRTYGNHNTKYCRYSKYSRSISQFPQQPYQPSGYSNLIKNDVFLESAHRGNASRYDMSNRYFSRSISVPSTYSSPYMPRPGTPTRNFAKQISPIPNRTGTMGRGSARESRSHGNSWSGRSRFCWRNYSRRYSGTGQNNGLRNINSQPVHRSASILNQKANLVYNFDRVSALKCVARP